MVLGSSNQLLARKGAKKHSIKLSKSGNISKDPASSIGGTISSS